MGITPGSDPTVDCKQLGPEAGHVCVKCGGQVVLGIVGAGSANLDFLWVPHSFHDLEVCP